MALHATVDGQTTAHYIADAVAQTGVSTTTPAQGVPIGGELNYLDDGTIGAALRASCNLSATRARIAASKHLENTNRPHNIGNAT